jgi:erythromycin esterase-like protein
LPLFGKTLIIKITVLPAKQRSLEDIVTRAAVRLRSGETANYDPLFEMIADHGFVLIGEASHGTHEFYRERAQLTKRLIQNARAITFTHDCRTSLTP